MRSSSLASKVLPAEPAASVVSLGHLAEGKAISAPRVIMAVFECRS